MFVNQGWELPEELGGHLCQPKEQITLWKAVELFLAYPEIKASANRWRHEIALVNLAEKLGKDTPLKSISVPSLKAYQMERLNKKVQPSAVNRELSTLSRLFGVMIELQLVEVNPVRLVRSLSEKTSERQAYLSFKAV